MPSQEPLAFISYRRTDSSAASRWLARSIAQTFGAQAVFIDTEAIRMSDDWAEIIKRALESATLLIPVIGRHWLSAVDQYSRRRLDNEDDWVRNEIQHALEAKIRILPVLLSKTLMPEPAAYPANIANLSRFQGFELRDERWESDLSLLLASMVDLGFRRVSTDTIRYPTPQVSLRELTDAELREARQHLPEWSWVVSDLPHELGRQRSEIHRSYEFASFEDAMAFMGAAVLKISELQHHPRWQNVWRTVSVWLTTWDIGHKPSKLDLELAAFLDTLRLQFPPKRI